MRLPSPAGSFYRDAADHAAISARDTGIDLRPGDVPNGPGGDKLGLRNMRQDSGAVSCWRSLAGENEKGLAVSGTRPPGWRFSGAQGRAGALPGPRPACRARSPVLGLLGRGRLSFRLTRRGQRRG